MPRWVDTNGTNFHEYTTAAAVAMARQGKRRGFPGMKDSAMIVFVNIPEVLAAELGIKPLLIFCPRNQWGWTNAKHAKNNFLTQRGAKGAERRRVG